MLDPLFKGMAWLLAQLYALIPNYGVAIVLLTCVVMLVLAPLTVKQTRSMLAMQKLQPELNKLRAQHKGDRQAMSQAQMELFQEHGVNPLAGCLPMVVQMPVLIVMYNVISGMAHRPRPKYLTADTKIFQDLVRDAGEFRAFGMNLAEKVTANHGGFLDAIPYYSLLVLAIFTSWFQMKRMYARNPAALTNNPQAQMMNRIMPAMMGVFMISVPAGVALYFLVSNVFRIAQQEAMYAFDPHISSHATEARKEYEAKLAEEEKAKPKKVVDVTEAPTPRLFGRRGGEAAPPAPNGKTNGPKAQAPGRAQPKGSQGRRKKGKRR